MKSFFLALLLFFGAVAAHGQCPNTQNFATSTPIVASGSTQLIAAPGNDPNTGRALALHICAFTLTVSQSATPASWSFTSGTGAACATGSSQVLPVQIGVASGTQSFGQVYTSFALPLPTHSALCLNLSAVPTGATVHVIYSIY